MLSGEFTTLSQKLRIIRWRRENAAPPLSSAATHAFASSRRLQQETTLKTADRPDQPSPGRRKLLWGMPAGLVAVQGCGGGAVTSAVAAPAVASTPTSTSTPTPLSTPAATPAVATPAISPVSAWAARPAAVAATGQAVLVPDVGVGGSLWYSNGTAWVPMSNPLILAHKFSNARMNASVGQNSDVLLDSYTIPAYVLGPSSALRITAAFSFPGTGTASKAPQVKAYFGVGTYASGFTTLLDSRGQFATQKSCLLNVTLQNRNSMSANQIRPNDYNIGASMNAFAAVAIDFTQDVTIAFGALNSSTSVSADDQQVLDWFSIEMLA